MFHQWGILIFFCLLFIQPIQSFAEGFPWVRVGQDDIRVIEDPKLEAAFRLELIDQAQKSLDIATFDQRADASLGLPVIQALERAAKRGIQIRFAASWIATVLKDPTRKAAKELKRIAERYPNFQFILVGGKPMWAHGWGYLDGIHQKLFIVDRTINLVTGRGHADEYLTWLDTAFLMKGKLVLQSQITFDRTWKAIEKENGKVIQLSPSPPLDSSELSTDAQTYGVDEEELKALREWIRLPSPPFEERTKKGRVLYQNFLEQMENLENPISQYSYDDRSRLLKDPVLEAAIELVKKSKSCELSILATIIDPRFKEIVIQRLSENKAKKEEDQFKFTILTNGKKSHATVTPIPISPGWYAGLADLDDLMQKGAIAYELNPEGKDSFQFIHRKLLVCDDTVIFGSHNLTLASTLVQDEVSYEEVDPEFAAQMREITFRSIEKYGLRLDPALVHAERLETPLIQWFSGFLDKLYFQ